mmetsp:Transcript_13911/g.32843  ORF Transcript_13911/g.32843 Transcript_13911/m.32843 type:complete len:375 (-) Transcript_13911:805-1929(-)
MASLRVEFRPGICSRTEYVPRLGLPRHFVKRKPCVSHQRRSSCQKDRILCSGTQKRDYNASAADKVILRLPPGHHLQRQDVKRVFDYPTDLTEKYQLEEVIGKGSFGIVYRAIDRNTGLAYACKSICKIPKKQNHTTPHHLLKIRSEVDCMRTLGASLDAVFLKDTFEDENDIHLIMELCTGGPLIQSMDVSKLSEKRVAELIRSILRFLAQCHSKGLIYRDIKPGNFLYSTSDPESPLKATDFGLMIQHADSDPPLTTRAGTPVYLAPEVVTRNYSKQADIYSVGVLCFQLLTGRFPYWPSNSFKAPTLNEVMPQARCRSLVRDHRGIVCPTLKPPTFPLFSHSGSSSTSSRTRISTSVGCQTKASPSRRSTS